MGGSCGQQLGRSYQFGDPDRTTDNKNKNQKEDKAVIFRTLIFDKFIENGHQSRFLYFKSIFVNLDLIHV